jgi:hypothetical protein
MTTSISNIAKSSNFPRIVGTYSVITKMYLEESSRLSRYIYIYIQGRPS